MQCYRGVRAGGIPLVPARGVNPCLSDEVSGRYLSFPEREDIAVWQAQGAGVRDRPQARTGAVDGLP